MIFTFIHPTHLTLPSGLAIAIKLFLCDFGHLRTINKIKPTKPITLDQIHQTLLYYIYQTESAEFFLTGEADQWIEGPSNKAS